MKNTNIKKSNLHQITVTFFKNGQEVYKKVPLVEVDLAINLEDDTTITLGNYLEMKDKRIDALEKELNVLKENVATLNENDVEWKMKTNEVLTTILRKIDESEMI